MGGLISGFVGGFGKAMAEVGKMGLADKLLTERQEADFLRESEFRKNERVSGQEFTAGESALDRKSRENIAADKAKALKAGSGATSQQKNIDDLIRRGFPQDVAVGLIHKGFKTIEDKVTGEMVVVNAANNVELGRLVNYKGQGFWLGKGEELPDAKVTKADRTQAKNEGKEKAGLFSLDATDFGEGMTEQSWVKNRQQEIANERRAAEKLGSDPAPTPPIPKPGIVDSKTTTPVEASSKKPTESQSATVPQSAKGDPDATFKWLKENNQGVSEAAIIKAIQAMPEFKDWKPQASGGLIKDEMNDDEIKSEPGSSISPISVANADVVTEPTTPAASADTVASAASEDIDTTGANTMAQSIIDARYKNQQAAAAKKSRKEFTTKMEKEIGIKRIRRASTTPENVAKVVTHFREKFPTLNINKQEQYLAAFGRFLKGDIKDNFAKDFHRLTIPEAEQYLSTFGRFLGKDNREKAQLIIDERKART